MHSWVTSTMPWSSHFGVKIPTAEAGEWISPGVSSWGFCFSVNNLGASWGFVSWWANFVNHMYNRDIFWERKPNDLWRLKIQVSCPSIISRTHGHIASVEGILVSTVQWTDLQEGCRRLRGTGPVVSRSHVAPRLCDSLSWDLRAQGKRRLTRFS